MEIAVLVLWLLRAELLGADFVVAVSPLGSRSANKLMRVRTRGVKKVHAHFLTRVEPISRRFERGWRETWLCSALANFVRRLLFCILSLTFYNKSKIL